MDKRDVVANCILISVLAAGLWFMTISETSTYFFTGVGARISSKEPVSISVQSDYPYGIMIDREEIVLVGIHPEFIKIELTGDMTIVGTVFNQLVYVTGNHKLLELHPSWMQIPGHYMFPIWISTLITGLLFIVPFRDDGDYLPLLLILLQKRQKDEIGQISQLLTWPLRAMSMSPVIFLLLAVIFTVLQKLVFRN